MKDLIRANAGLLFAGVATFMLMGAGQSLYGPALPVYGRDLSLGPTQTGWIVSAHWIGCAIGVGLMYFHSSRVGPRSVLAMMALGAAMLAASAGVIATYAGAAVFGMGYGMATVVFNPRILRAFGARGTSMLSLLNATFGIGAIVAPLVFVWLGSRPDLAFGIMALLAVAIWLGSGAASRTAATPSDKTGAGTFRPMLAFQLFAVAGIGLEATLIGLGPSALIRAGLAEQTAAQLLSAFFVAFLGIRVILIFTAHLAAPFTLYIGAMIAAAASAFLAAFVSPGIFFVVMGLSAGLFFPSFYVAASALMGDDPRTPSTIIAAGLVGGIAAPIVLSPLLSALGGSGFFVVLGCVASLAAGAAVVIRQRLRELRG